MKKLFLLACMLTACLVINKEREVVYKTVGFPGVEVMKREILNVLN